MTTFKFYLHARSPQDIIDLFTVSPGAPIDGRTTRLSYLRIPGLRGDEIVVECLFRDADAANALEDYVADNEFSLPGLKVLDDAEFKALQASAATRVQVPATTGSRVTLATPVSIDPQSFAGCGDSSYRVPPKRSED